MDNIFKRKTLLDFLHKFYFWILLFFVYSCHKLFKLLFEIVGYKMNIT